MSFSNFFCIFVPIKNSFTLPLIHTSIMATVYDFKVLDKKKNQVSLSDYKGKVLLIVNTATGCGFTPQYEDLEAMYHRLKDQGFEILDFPWHRRGDHRVLHREIRRRLPTVQKERSKWRRRPAALQVAEGAERLRRLRHGRSNRSHSRRYVRQDRHQLARDTRHQMELHQIPH